MLLPDRPPSSVRRSSLSSCFEAAHHFAQPRFIFSSMYVYAYNTYHRFTSSVFLLFFHFCNASCRATTLRTAISHRPWASAQRLVSINYITTLGFVFWAPHAHCMPWALCSGLCVRFCFLSTRLCHRQQRRRRTMRRLRRLRRLFDSALLFSLSFVPSTP